MFKKITYDDRFNSFDNILIEIIGESYESERSEIKKLLLRVIRNELTEKQQKIIVMYYYKNMKIQEIADKTGVTPQAVSAMMARARNRIYRILRYYYC